MILINAINFRDRKTITAFCTPGDSATLLNGAPMKGVSSRSSSGRPGSRPASRPASLRGGRSRPASTSGVTAASLGAGESHGVIDFVIDGAKSGDDVKFIRVTDPKNASE